MSVNYSNTRVGSFIADDVTARDAIPAGNRFEGMEVLALDTGIKYRLAANLTTWNKSGVIFDPALRSLWVEPDTGDDSAVGTIGNPLKTQQEAVNRFKPMSMGIQYWALDDDRQINVMGTGKFQESVVIPAHAGMGALRIVGEETVLHEGLAVNGSTSAIAGFEVRRRLSFTTAPMTPSALADGYFVRPQARTVTENNFEFQWSMIPIVDNAAGSIDGPILIPGSLTAFDLGSGVLVDIVQPKRIQQPAANDQWAFVEGCCFLNLGGALIVEGLEFQARDDVQIANRGVVLAALGSIGNEYNGSAYLLSRCVIRHNAITGLTFSSIVSGDAASMTGCLVVGGSERLSTGSRGMTIVNLRASGGLTLSALSTAFTFYGLDSTLGIYIYDCKGSLSADIRPSATEALLLTGGSRVETAVFSVEGCTAPRCIFADTQSTLTLFGGGGSIVGTTGNTGIGVELEALSYCNATTAGSITLSGSGGDIKVGALAVQAWGAGSTTDPTELARLREA